MDAVRVKSREARVIFTQSLGAGGDNEQSTLYHVIAGDPL